MSAIYAYLRNNWVSLAIGLSTVLIISITVQALKEEPCPIYMSWYQCIAHQIFKYFNDWAIVLSATVTLLLAIAAFGAIAENRRIRLEDIELEATKHSLDEVLRWAGEAYAALITTSLSNLQDEQRQMIFKLTPISARTPVIREYSEWFGGELPNHVDNAIENLQNFTKVLQEEVDKIVTFGDEWPTGAFTDSLEELRKSLENVMSVASVQRVGIYSSITFKDIYRGFNED